MPLFCHWFGHSWTLVQDAQGRILAVKCRRCKRERWCDQPDLGRIVQRWTGS